MRLLSAVTAALLLTAVSAASASSAIDVQFSSGSGHAQTGAAVIGQANDVWNDFTTGTLADQFLVNTSGAQSGVTLSFSSAQSYESDASYTRFTGTPYANLMQGYLVDRGNPDLALTFGGLAAGQEYGFYIYTQGDDNSKNRSIGISANGGAQVSSTQSNIGTFVEGDNYLYDGELERRRRPRGPLPQRRGQHQRRATARRARAVVGRAADGRPPVRGWRRGAQVARTLNPSGSKEWPLLERPFSFRPPILRRCCAPAAPPVAGVRRRVPAARRTAGSTRG